MNTTATTRERILKATLELVSSRGYAGSTTREIAQRAGVAEVTLFRQFANKESLFAEVLRTFSSAPALPELMPQLKSLPYHEALETLTIRFLERLEANRNWIRVLSYGVGYAPEEMRNVYDDFLKQLFGDLSDFFADAHDREVIRPDLDPEHAARAFHSMVFGLFHIEGLFDGASGLIHQRSVMISSFVKMFCRGTQPDAMSIKRGVTNFSNSFA